MEAEFNDNQRKKRIKRTKPPHIPQEMWEIDKRLYKDRFYVAARLKEENWKKAEALAEIAGRINAAKMEFVTDEK